MNGSMSTAAGTPVDAADLRERQIAVLGSWHQIGQVIFALAELGVADVLASGPREVAELSAATGTHTAALRRVLRCAAAVGIFAERADGRFELTPLAEGLLSEKVGGLAPMAQFSGQEHVRLSYAEILHSVRTGEPAFDLVYGMPFRQYLEENPGAARFHERFLTHFGRRLADRFVGRLGLHRFSRIADICAGTGYFLARMLAEQPSATGVLFDLPGIAATAPRVLTEHGVGDRVTVVPGDPFVDDLPTGCDLYTLKSLLHRWCDGRAEVLLRKVRAALGEVDGRVVVIDQIVPPLNVWDHAKAIDVDTLVLYGGQERNLAEWLELLAATGFELCNEPESRGWTFLELRPIEPRS